MIAAEIRASIDAYIAAWNEHDAAARMKLLERACADDVCMRTPGRRVDGRAQLDALMVDFQQRFPGARAVLASGIDVQGIVFRYAGIVQGVTLPGDGETFDAGEADERGRIRTLLTFNRVALPGRD